MRNCSTISHIGGWGPGSARVLRHCPSQRARRLTQAVFLSSPVPTYPAAGTGSWMASCSPVPSIAYTVTVRHACTRVPVPAPQLVRQPGRERAAHALPGRARAAHHARHVPRAHHLQRRQQRHRGAAGGQRVIQVGRSAVRRTDGPRSERARAQGRTRTAACTPLRGRSNLACGTGIRSVAVRPGGYNNAHRHLRGAYRPCQTLPCQESYPTAARAANWFLLHHGASCKMRITSSWRELQNASALPAVTHGTWTLTRWWGWSRGCRCGGSGCTSLGPRWVGVSNTSTGHLVSSSCPC